MRRAALSTDQGPTAEEQSSLFPRSLIHDQFADPQDPTNVSFQFLRRMRRDHIVAMGLHFIAMPIIKAPWYYQSDDARMAAFADAVLRPIYGRLVLCFLRMLWAGYSPGSKNFETVTAPPWTYMSSVESDPVLVWNQPKIDAIIFKPVTPVRPENAKPKWDDNGNFAGITYDKSYGGTGYFIIGGKRKQDIDLTHAFWAAHDIDSEDGSAYGFSRIAHCAPIFHMYRFIWTMLGRAFENNADPGPVVRYPSTGDNTTDSKGNPLKPVEQALLIGRRRRSGSTVALPSDMYVDYQDKPTGKYLWDIEYPKNETSFSEIQQFLGFLESAKLRCVTGDTPIDCPRDHERYPEGIPISQLREGQLIWCFNEAIETFELRPLKKVLPTRPNAELLKLTLDTGKVIRATPDHKFLKRDGTWVELQYLSPGDSLMPLERDFEPFVKIKPNDRGWLRSGNGGREYDMVARAVHGERFSGDHTHHLDERHINTSPENLKYLTNSEHSTLTHAGQRRPPGHHQRVLAGMGTRECADCGDKFDPRGPSSKRCEVCQALARFDQLSKPKPGAKTMDRPFRECQECERSYVPTSNAQKWCPACRAHKWLERSRANPVTLEEWLVGLPNHKVATIEPCDREDTWDLSVDGPPECHNFVVHGVVLHNSIWLQEQGLIEGSGGQSNRNVASEFGSQRDESQAVLMAQIDGMIDEMFMKPIIAMNFPMFSGTLEKKTFGFGQNDEDVVRQVIQLIGQAQSENALATLGVNIQKLMDARGFPMYSLADQKSLRDKAAVAAEAAATPAVEPTQGRRALVTQTGFDREHNKPVMQYVQLGGEIQLAADDDFVAGLPRTDVFSDKQVIAATRNLRSQSVAFLSWAYGDFARYLGKQKSLSLDDLAREIAAEHFDRMGEHLDDQGTAAKIADRLISGWRPKVEKLSGYSDAASSALARVYDRTTGLHLERLVSKKRLSSRDKSATAWISGQVSALMDDVLGTIRTELSQALADAISEDVKPAQLATSVREYFDGTPAARASTIARTEISSAYNYATVQVGLAAGVPKAQIQPTGQIVDVADALAQNSEAGACIRLLLGAHQDLEVRHEPLDGLLARYDDDTHTVLFSPDLDEKEQGEYLLALGEQLLQPRVPQGDVEVP